ncbi:MAG: hypothetical protein GY861_20180 [bacterium]|nr:hypothetical protein [bacterium]
MNFLLDMRRLFSAVFFMFLQEVVGIDRKKWSERLIQLWYPTAKFVTSGEECDIYEVGDLDIVKFVWVFQRKLKSRVILEPKARISVLLGTIELFERAIEVGNDTAYLAAQEIEDQLEKEGLECGDCHDENVGYVRSEGRWMLIDAGCVRRCR